MAFLPALRPARPPRRASRRPAFFALAAGPSWLGGREESEESRAACRRSAATSTRSDSISAACSATTARQLRVPGSQLLVRRLFRCGIPEPNHDHKADASSDTPQINGGRDWLRPKGNSFGAKFRTERRLLRLLPSLLSADLA